MIKRGAADAVLAGGTESCIVPLILAGFTAMRGLAVEDEHPPHASRPFDATRAGFVMSEGAGALLLEDWEHAERRGAEIYAEVLGYGASNDAHHMAQPEPEATGVAAMMRGALERAGVEPERVGYINAHGTSTPLGDAAETRAIKDVFGDHAYELAVSSTKSMMGHTFGAAGAIEAIMCVLALRDGVLPPTINYREPDPDCDLDYVPNEARRTQARCRALERDGPRRPQRLRPARPRRLVERAGQLGDRAEHDVGLRERVVAGREVRVRDRERRPCPAAFAERMPLWESSTAAQRRARRRAAAPPRGRRRAPACRAPPPRTRPTTRTTSASPAARKHDLDQLAVRRRRDPERPARRRRAAPRRARRDQRRRRRRSARASARRSRR